MESDSKPDGTLAVAEGAAVYASSLSDNPQGLLSDGAQSSSLTAVAATAATAAVVAHSSPGPPAGAPASPVAHKPKTRRASSHSHKLSSSSTASGSVASRKSKHAEAGTTDAHADRASISMPPPPAHALRSPRSSFQHSRPGSFSNSTSNSNSNSNSDAWSVEEIRLKSQSDQGGARGPAATEYPLQFSPRDFAVDTASANPTAIASAAAAVGAAAASGEDFDTPRLQAGASVASTDSSGHHHVLPEPALSGYRGRTSFSDADSTNKRISVSSIYSLASARGVSSSAASANGSDNNSSISAVPHRSYSGLMASSAPSSVGAGGVPKAPATVQPESSVTNTTVTTASQGSSGTHQLAPREQSHQLGDTTKKQNHQVHQPSGPLPHAMTTPTPRPQPTRSRSRAKRRFSGSTAASSQHSPSGDRVVLSHRAEKEEVKPPTWGVIGVCALDVKARSKPSRNILNRLIQNRDFDVCVFGDKVILDEGKLAIFNSWRFSFVPPPLSRWHLFPTAEMNIY